jgi:hypothetical protein
MKLGIARSQRKIKPINVDHHYFLWRHPREVCRVLERTIVWKMELAHTEHLSKMIFRKREIYFT